ncbi:hypothetical protein OROMI_009552 [Orobanche minor]
MGKLAVEIQNVILQKAPKNATYTSPDFQKQILHILAEKVRKKIRGEVGNAKFCILVDEAKDVADKQQMAIVLRFVDSEGFIKERFFDIVNVAHTNAETLKKEICDVLGRNDLYIKNIRGQGYDGASNMSGAWNGLQALFIRECPQAYYVHCFAHRLQLALVGAAEKQGSVWVFFSELTSIVNMIKGSPKRDNELKSAQAIEIAERVATGVCETGSGLNQMGSLRRAGKTRWSSHFESICSMIDMYHSVIIVLEHIEDEADNNPTRGQATCHLRVMKSFDFLFMLYMMNKVMAITYLLCEALQSKSLDILQAMDLISNTKDLLCCLRADGYDILLKSVQLACERIGVQVPDMNTCYALGRACRRKDSITFEHHYHFDIFNAVIDLQLEEISSRFDEESMELLRLSSALEPRENFKMFDDGDIYRLAEEFYPNDFSGQELHYLRSQLEHYKFNIIHSGRFNNLSNISELCRRLVETGKAQYYHLIDRLIRLVLTLPVSTATTERSFSAMKLVKTDLRNKMEDEYLADCLMVYIEREFAAGIDTNLIIDEFYSKKHRRVQLK